MMEVPSDVMVALGTLLAVLINLVSSLMNRNTLQKMRLELADFKLTIYREFVTKTDLHKTIKE